jgi:uncharacterized protein YndB with AHSA1/START domain
LTTFFVNGTLCGVDEERRLELEIALDATPEQVWDAIATGPGISSWFVPTEVRHDDTGHHIRQDFGAGFVVDGRVTAWEQGRRFAYGEAQAEPSGQERPAGPSYAFEFLVEGRAGGSTVLRFVQSGFLTDRDGWETEYDSFRNGWAMFFATLAAYLEHFAGRPVHNVVTMGFSPLAPDQAWNVFHGALGLAGRPSVGDRVRLTPDGLPAIGGVVDLATPQFLGVRSADALYRFGAEGTSGCGVSAYHYFFGDSADPTSAWQDWLTGLFPMPAEPVTEPVSAS